MKKDLHPKDYRLVVYKDSNSGDMWLTKSTAPAKENIKYTDGNEYPLIKLDISSQSHPLFTGIIQFVDTAGRIDKFNSRYGNNMKK